MLRLKDRQRQIPNGYKFYLPEVKWSAPSNFPSFEKVVQALEQVIQANPFLAQKNKWPTQHKDVQDWVDTYNAALCSQMGWTEYIVTDQGPSLPKSTPQHQQETLRSLSAVAARARELVAGAKSLTEWIDSGEPAVPEEKSTHRAIVCSKCPLNQEGDWTRWFTSSASELIKRQVQKAQDRKLTTPRDDQINICVACHCPLKLKVHVPIGWISKRLTDEQKAKLAGGKDCWIIQEIALA